MNGTQEQEQTKEAVYTTILKGLKIVIKPARKEVIQGVVFAIPGKSIEFQDGFFRTSDPFIQRVIESKRYFGVKVLRLSEVEAQIEKAKLAPPVSNVTELKPKTITEDAVVEIKTCPKCGKSYAGVAYTIHERKCQEPEKES